MSSTAPTVLADWMRPFASLFTPAVWRHAMLLVAGTVLTPGRRTVTAALRVMGLQDTPSFAVYHRVLIPTAFDPDRSGSKASAAWAAAAPVGADTDGHLL